MMKKLLGLAVVVALVLFAVSPSQAFWGMGGKGRGEREKNSFHGMRMMKKLDLTQQQKDSITAKEKDLGNKTAPLKKSVKDLRSKISGELAADNPDKEKIDKIIEEISSNTVQLEKKRIEFVLWFRTQLTPEQKQKLTSIIKKREAARKVK